MNHISILNDDNMFDKKEIQDGSSKNSQKNYSYQFEKVCYNNSNPK